jgi:hypothetical protein
MARPFALVSIAAALALALAAPALGDGAAVQAARLKNCGAIDFSGTRTTILVIRHTRCKTARRVARAYDRGSPPRRWRCALSHGDARYRGQRYGFSCGRGGGKGDLKAWRHAFIGAL